MESMAMTGMLGYLVNWTMDDVDDQKGGGGYKIWYAGSHPCLIHQVTPAIDLGWIY